MSPQGQSRYSLVRSPLRRKSRRWNAFTSRKASLSASLAILSPRLARTCQPALKALIETDDTSAQMPLFAAADQAEAAELKKLPS